MYRYGKLLIVIGLVIILLAGYGFINLEIAASNNGLSKESAEAIIELGTALGAKSKMNFMERVELFAIQKRFTLLIVGLAMLLVGIACKKNEQKEHQKSLAEEKSRSSENSYWICEKCFTNNPSYMVTCQKCGQAKSNKGEKNIL